MLSPLCNRLHGKSRPSVNVYEAKERRDEQHCAVVHLFRPAGEQRACAERTGAISSSAGEKQPKAKCSGEDTHIPIQPRRCHSPSSLALPSLVCQKRYRTIAIRGAPRGPGGRRRRLCTQACARTHADTHGTALHHTNLLRRRRGVDRNGQRVPRVVIRQ